MPSRTFRYTAATVFAGLVALVLAPGAAAEPVTPPAPPPYIPGSVLPYPGSFSYPYNVIVTNGPPATDARGAQVSSLADADPGLTLSGMPGSVLGNGPIPGGPLTSSNARYGISAGMAPESTPSPGVDIVAGNQFGPLEDPQGQPPKQPGPPEPTWPTTTPGGSDVPEPVLEDPHGQGAGGTH